MLHNHLGSKRWCLLKQDSWVYFQSFCINRSREKVMGAHTRTCIFIMISGITVVAGPRSSFSGSLLLVIDFFVDPFI